MSYKIGNLTLDNPIILAPMDGYTDIPFRTIIKEMGADLIYTEFAHSDALLYENIRSMKKVRILEEERPVVIQIFGKDPDKMARAAKLMEELNPDYLDLNFGCPSPTVAGNGSGSALLKNLPLLEKICETVVSTVKLPVTAKTRIGWDSKTINILETVKVFERTGIQAVTLHPRTRAQKFTGLSDWSFIKLLKENTHLPVIGNGDIRTPEDAKRMFDETSCDGVMIGREAISNPWIFKQVQDFLNSGVYEKEIPIHERIRVCQRHIDLATIWKGEVRAMFEMRKLYGYYFKGIPNLKRFKKLAFASSDIQEIKGYVDNIESIVNDEKLDILELPPVKNLKAYIKKNGDIE
ncbi:MAG: tRNA dihydrouridine synthase DusB [Candidatus Delongbacteria bacterium]|nr:tRNA dihydrouridine synthase DusB [Candidatus Delongbacteria bacterium]MBN2836458.1 tRNA dihydrouridine synthase DusB [Candidatus Delongbacteria bacterium]